jgi:hypothetical protein
MRVVATRHLRAEVSLSAPLDPVPPGRPKEMRAWLARTTESRIRRDLT